jgi:Zn-dependent peptidase ImmA (M78 family)
MQYVFEQFAVSPEALFAAVNAKRKRPLPEENLRAIIKGEIVVPPPILKKIDQLFQKGATWYTAPRAVPAKESSSVFFRKDTFNAELNLQSRRIVDHFERLKLRINFLGRYIDFTPKRSFRIYTTGDDPAAVAKEVRNQFDQAEVNLKRVGDIRASDIDDDRLKNLIRIIESFDVFVFEFMETWNQKEKANFNGFFLAPNLIVLKKNSNYRRREILTLMHEFGHFLLNKEEIDKVSETYDSKELNNVEAWCYAFAVHFLLGDKGSEFYQDSFASLSAQELNNKLDAYTETTLLSKSALLMRARMDRGLPENQFSALMEEIRQSVLRRRDEEKRAYELEKAQVEAAGGQMMRIPRVIESRLYTNILTANFVGGNIDEGELSSLLRSNRRNVLKGVAGSE